MKKVLLLALVVLFAASAVLAAPAAKQAASATNGSKNLAIGATQGFCSIRYCFTPEITGALGLNNTSGNLFGSATGILIKGEYNLAKSGNVQPNIGLFYTTNGAATATTSFGLTYGVSTMVESNLSLGVDLVLLTSTSVGGVSGTAILPGINLAASYFIQ